jgi:hypothetical protein
MTVIPHGGHVPAYQLIDGPGLLYADIIITLGVR